MKKNIKYDDYELIADDTVIGVAEEPSEREKGETQLETKRKCYSISTACISLRETPKFDRPREKMLERGVKTLSNLELIAAMIGTGHKGRGLYKVAQDIVDLTEREYNDLTLAKLEKIKGVGKARACRIIAAIEFSRRHLIKEGIQIKTHRDVLNLVTELSEKKQEYFLTLTIDGDNKLIRKRTVFIGTLNQSLVHPREVFADAITDRAAGIVFVHNHPSGNSSPSINDFEVTDRLLGAGKIMGIEILDHIIVGKNSYYSFQKSGYFKKRRI